MTSDRDKLDGVSFFLDEIEVEVRSLVTDQPTKPNMIATMQVVLNYVNTIKGIIE